MCFCASLGLDFVMVGFQVKSSAHLPDVVMTGCFIVFPLFLFIYLFIFNFEFLFKSRNLFLQLQQFNGL